jgi:hypothetical protein
MLGFWPVAVAIGFCWGGRFRFGCFLLLFVAFSCDVRHASSRVKRHPMGSIYPRAENRLTRAGFARQK